MSLSPPVPRDPIHARRIDCRGYRRSDGLWDIEGHLTDTKSYGFANSFRGEIAPGEPIHDMWLRLTLDDELTVIRAEAVTAAGPFAICPAITPAFTKLEGLQDRSGLAAGRAGAPRRRSRVHASGRAARAARRPPRTRRSMPGAPGTSRR